MTLSNESCKRELLERLRSLENLNPDLKMADSDRLFSLARQVGPESFPEVAQETSRLINLYLKSDIKTAGANVMREYFFELEQNKKLLLKSGDIEDKARPISNTFTTALVPKEQLEPLDFCKLLNRAVIPKPLIKAADAFRRRTEVVSSVFEIAFRVLWLIDAPATAQWLSDYFKANEGALDPDIARDAMMTALLQGSSVSQEFLQWAIRFASDPNLQEYWPVVTHQADRLLEITALQKWYQRYPLKNSLLAQLRLYIRLQRFDEETLLSWCKNALDEIGNSVQRFISLENTTIEPRWRALSLTTELHRIAHLTIPVLLLAEQILALPDGAATLAMAFMGLAGETLERWEEQMNEFAFRAVKRSFMLGLKMGYKPVDTIRRLTFGDTNAFNMAYSELDLNSENFDSIKQRDKVARFLSIFYASYRRPQLLGVEIAKRYHNLMKMLHEDFLHNVLDAHQLKEIQETQVLQEISSIASQARKFLQKRKATENTLEQISAATIAFQHFVREKRISIIQDLLK